MRRWIIALLVFGLLGSSEAGLLRPIRIYDGGESIPCDGIGHSMADVPVYANVAKVYMFANMSPNGVNGMDVSVTSNAYGDPATLAEVHLFRVTPSSGIQGEMERTFAPDRVYVTTVHADISCAGGGYVNIFAEVWVD